MLNNPIQLWWQHIFKEWFVSLFKLDLETTHPMAPMTGFFQALAVVFVFCLWNFYMSNNKQCIGFLALPMRTVNSCSEETFRGNLFIMIVGISTIWLYPILKEKERSTKDMQYINSPWQQQPPSRFVQLGQ
jgi:hypothetical protein